MTSSRKKGDQGEYEFTRAAWDELRDSQANFRVEYDVTLHPTKRPGVWELSIVAWRLGQEAQEWGYCSYRAEWPNAQVQSYGAFLYGACHRIVRMTEEKINHDIVIATVAG